MSCPGRPPGRPPAVVELRRVLRRLDQYTGQDQGFGPTNMSMTCSVMAIRAVDGVRCASGRARRSAWSGSPGRNKGAEPFRHKHGSATNQVLRRHVARCDTASSVRFIPQHSSPYEAEASESRYRTVGAWLGSMGTRPTPPARHRCRGSGGSTSGGLPRWAGRPQQSPEQGTSKQSAEHRKVTP
jgi:hypothetical protein